MKRQGSKREQTGPWQSPEFPRTAIPTIGGMTDEETGLAVARTVTSSEVAAYRVVKAADAKTGVLAHVDVPTLLEHLRAEAKAVQDGSLAQAEAMLANQAVALQSLFARLVERGMGNDTVPAFEANMRFALRAQSQCRATLETLALVRNGPAVYARQANIAHGPQQVNNGMQGAARAGENPAIQQPELLEPPSPLAGVAKPSQRPRHKVSNKSVPIVPGTTG
jgi:hypothetical protein